MGGNGEWPMRELTSWDEFTAPLSHANSEWAPHSDILHALRVSGFAYSDDPALAAVSAALLGIAGDLSVDTVLERLVHAARELVQAEYAALGTPDHEDEGETFSRFITAGMDEALIERLGPLPRTHGL